MQKRKSRKSPYSKYGKMPWRYSDQLRNWSAIAKGEIAGSLIDAGRAHRAYLLRVNGWRRLPSEEFQWRRI